MPRFKYHARNRAGEKVGGIMLAENDEQLALTLRQMDLFLVGAKPEKVSTPIYITRPVKRRELIDFTVHLATSIGAGIPILETLMDLEHQTTNHVMKRATQEIVNDLQGGSALSIALSRHPLIFSEIYTSTVKAGEIGGRLEGVLQHLIEFLEWQDGLASEVKRAMIYPVVVLAAVGVLLGVLVGFVFPRLLLVIKGLDVPLPLITRVVIVAGNFAQDGWFFLLLAAVSFFVLIRLMKVSEGGKYIIDAIKLRLPVIGELVEKICLSRFAHHLGILMGAGIDITQSLSITERVVGNAVVARALRETQERVVQGGSLWQSMQETGVFPPLVVRMVFVGESTGTIEGTMTRVTAFYDREIPATVKRLFAVLEPLIIVIIAVIVLAMALSIFIPLYTFMGQVGRR